MKPFAYARPDTAEEAVALGSDEHATYLAGGTNLVDLMKLGVHAPSLLVDITGLLPDTITADDDGVRIGAGVSNSDLAADPFVRQRFPVISEATLSGASGQLRNMATTGGNLLQHTRCAYFQDVTKPCNLRAPGTGCPAREGEHRNLAILGASEECIATHPSDLAVALAALDATVRVEGAGGARDLTLDELFATPLGHGQLLTSVHVPTLSYARNSHYVKVRERASFAFAIGSVAAALDVADGAVRDVRLAFGAVAPKPWRARVAEDALRGGPADEAAFRTAVSAELSQARPLRDNGYKVGLITELAVRLLTRLAAS